MRKKRFDFDVYAGLRKPPETDETGDEIATDEAMVKAIMIEIGFGFEPSWYSGSSCNVSRKQALTKLIRAIKTRHEDGECIAPPIAQLFEQLVMTINFEETSTPNSLQRTWKVAQNVIRHHIRLHDAYLGRDRKIAIGDARREAEELITAPQTEEERREARTRATVSDPDGTKEFERRRRKVIKTRRRH